MLHGIIQAQHSYTREMFWIEAEALEHGPEPASELIAVWGAILSAEMDLDHNCQLLEKLKTEYGTGPLPTDRAVIAGMLGAIHGKAARERTIEGIYRAKALDEQGMLHQFLSFPDDLEGQRAWRERLSGLVYGLGFKTASMVALVLFPTRSHLVPVDQHVMKRFDIRTPTGEPDDKSPGNKKRYHEIEDMVLAEREEVAQMTGAKECKGLETHWLTWMWRREEQADERGGKMAGENHLRLNCHKYFIPYYLQ